MREKEEKRGKRRRRRTRGRKGDIYDEGTPKLHCNERTHSLILC